jgi:plasmid stability protein
MKHLPQHKDLFIRGLDPELVKAIRIKCFERDQTVSQFIEPLLRAAVQTEKKGGA